MGAAKKVALAGTKNQPSGKTGYFPATLPSQPPTLPTTGSSPGLVTGIAKGIQKKAANDAFRGNNKSTQKGKGPTKRPLPPKPPEDRMSIMPVNDTQLAPGGHMGPPKDDYFDQDRFNRVQSGQVNLSKNERGNVEAVPTTSGPPFAKLPIKDDYFAQDRFNKVQSGQVNLSKNERGNIEASRPPLPDGWLEDRRMQAKRNDQRNAAENRMRRGRGGFKGGRR